MKRYNRLNINYTDYTEPRDTAEDLNFNSIDCEVYNQETWSELVELQNAEHLTTEERREIKNKLARRAIEGL